MLEQRQLEFAAEDAGVRSGGARWPAARLLFVCSSLSRPGPHWKGRASGTLWFSQDNASSSRFSSACGEGKNPGKGRGQLQVSRPPGQQLGSSRCCHACEQGTQRCALSLSSCLCGDWVCEGALVPSPRSPAVLPDPRESRLSNRTGAQGNLAASSQTSSPPRSLGVLRVYSPFLT